MHRAEVGGARRPKEHGFEEAHEFGNGTTLETHERCGQHRLIGGNFDKAVATVCRKDMRPVKEAPIRLAKLRERRLEAGHSITRKIEVVFQQKQGFGSSTPRSSQDCQVAFEATPCPSAREFAGGSRSVGLEKARVRWHPAEP